MQISHNQLKFGWTDIRKDLIIKNNTCYPLIFKIKTTDLQLLSATPCKGTIQPNEQKKVEVKCNQTQRKFTAKLQVIAAQQKDKIDSFQVSWSKVQQNAFILKLVLLSRQQKLSPIKQEQYQYSNQKLDQNISSQSQESSNFNLSQSTIGLTSTLLSKNSKNDKLNKSKKSMSNIEDNMLRSQTTPFKSSYEYSFSQNDKEQKRNTILQTKLFEEDSKSFQNSILNREKSYKKPSFLSSVSLQNICHLQSQLLSNKEQNQRLKNQLRRTVSIDRERQERIRQNQVNNSMRQQCQHEKIDWPVVALVALLFFVIGVLVSNVG